jgi:hypothetical protein
VTSVEDRLASLEARVRELEARMGGQVVPAAPPPAAPGAVAADDAVSWLDQVSALAASGNRDQAIAVYRENMAADEHEASSFVDDLIANPVKGS